MGVRATIGTAAALGLGLALTLGAAAFTEPEPSALDVTSIQDTLSVPFGVAIDRRETTGEASLVLLHHFSQITAENAMKPEAWYDASHAFAPSDEIATLMDFAVAGDLRVYGHVLVWHRQIPPWFFTRDDGTLLTDSPEDQAILTTRLHDHIFAVAKYLSDGWGAFGGGNPVVAFDVVNEVISDSADAPGGLHQSTWYQILGPQFIDLAFQYADEAFNDVYAAPGADTPVTLFINEYNTEDPGKRARYLALIDDLIARGIPIGGIGHQFHVYPSVPIQSLADALEESSGRGLVQAITEFDEPLASKATPAAFLAQGYYYRDAFRVFREYEDELFSITVWGLYDARSWRGAQGGPLIFDDQLRVKPAYYGIVDGFADETPLADLTVPRDWTPVIVVGSILGLIAAAVGVRTVRRRRRTEWSRDRKARAVEQHEATPGDALDALNRELPKKRRGRR